MTANDTVSSGRISNNRLSSSRSEQAAAMQMPEEADRITADGAAVIGSVASRLAAAVVQDVTANKLQCHKYQLH